MAISKELRARVLSCVREYRAEQGETAGLDFTFQELEDEACELADEVARALIAESLAEQAAHAANESQACCPRCGRRDKAAVDTEPRLLDTRRGQVQWVEPKHYCTHCRQSFFPSVPRVGD